MTTENNISKFLSYANLQMAAEALLDDVKELKDRLISGNRRSSKFTSVLVDQFIADGWTVLKHKSNTSTGFSGTLFKNSQTGELVLSFRSTEFADDAVRDNQATNKLEISEFGWAFGQIADMKNWVDGLYADGKISAGTPLNVTGYSLGGHLATAFNMLYPGVVQGTYTFNGAGVGTIDTGSLTEVITTFEQQRNGTGITFTTQAAANRYAMLKARTNPTITVADITNAETDIGMSPGERELFSQALKRAKAVADEQLRVAGITDSGPGGPPVQVPIADIEAAQFDYQYAVLLAAQKTSSHLTDVVASGWQAYTGRSPAPGNTIPNFYDIFGANLPSAVANSQYHYGQATPIFIEDQPLYRGSVILDAIGETIVNAEAKLLVDNFSKNDFGDTHSLVLLVDSLNVQNLFAQLDPAISLESLSSILHAASNLRAESTSGTQGKAEGDVLESVLDGLRNIFMGQGERLPQTPFDTTGGDWAEPARREVFYANLKSLQDSDAFNNAIGKVQIESLIGKSAGSLATTAKAYFSTLLALRYVLPFALKGQGLANIWESAQFDLYAQWQTDQSLPANDDQGVRNFSDQWLEDRAKLVSWIMHRNLEDIGNDFEIAPNGSRDNWQFEDLASQTVVKTAPYFTLALSRTRPQHYVKFGKDNGDDTLCGGDEADKLYGGGGNDNLDGRKGDDYLEGNAGNDTLYGGDDRDELLGGDGDDTLLGGKGNDTLKGGTGADRYKFASGDGWDTVIDSDGRGGITFDGVALNGGDYVAANIWQEEDAPSGKTFTYSIFDRTENGETFKVLSIQGPNGGLWIKRWQEGQLGISLPGAQEPVEIQAGAPPSRNKETRWYKQPHAVVDGRGLGPQEFAAIGDFGEVYGSGRLLGNDSANYLHNGEGDDELFGMGGQDTLIATGGDDKLYGGDGNDALSSGDGNDLLDGGVDDDVLSGGSGNDVLLGGDGVDYLFGGGDYEAVHADWSVLSAGSDLDIRFNQFVGTSYLMNDGADLLRGGRGDDHLWGAVGDDQLFGEDDNDQLVGDAGDDFLDGGEGNDKLFGDGSQSGDEYRYTYPEYQGDDILDGGDGDDSLYGDGGSDELHGGAGNDRLIGDVNGLPIQYHGEDYLDGGDGDDRLWGYGKNDILLGGAGDDVLEGDSNTIAYADHGDDYLDGGEGADKMQGDGGDDMLLGGDGNDLLFGDADNVPVVSQGDDYLDGGEGDDYLRGYAGNDRLYGGAGIDQLKAEAGDDYLDGGEGNDTLEGEEGNDTLVGGAGADSLRGGAGDDVYVFNSGDGFDGAQIEVIQETGGKDTVRFGAGIALGALEISAVDDGSVLLIQSGSDQLAIDSGFTGEVEFFEFADGQRISYAGLIGRLVDSPITEQDAGGHEFHLGGRNDDTLIATQGHATLSGGRGNDLLQGSGGNNTYLYSLGDGTDRIADTGRRNDPQVGPAPNTLRFGAGITPANLSFVRNGNDLMIRLRGGADQITVLDHFKGAPIDRIEFDSGTIWDQAAVAANVVNELTDGADIYTGTAGNDTIAALGGDDQINAMGGDDLIDGGIGNDTLRGGDGNDQVQGSDGADTLYGDNGDDSLNGGAGLDTLHGGAGADVYLFSRGSGADRIIESGDAASVDMVRLAQGITASDLKLERNDNDLVIRILGTTDQMTVSGMFATGITGVASRIERIEFADFTQWNENDIRQRVLVDGATAGNDKLNGFDGNDLIHGLDGSDLIFGRDGDDRMWGGNGADSLSGNDGNDVLDGGAGDDALYGGEGNDVFVIGRGSGSDTLYCDDGSSAAMDVVQFIDSIAPADLQLSHEADDLYLAGPHGQLKLPGYFRSNGVNAVDEFRFDDGTVWRYSDIRAKLLAATDDKDTVIGFSTDDDLIGLSGNDYLDGAEGSDRISGGRGDDRLYGGSGNDILSGDDGNDQLEGGGGNDTLRGGAGRDSLVGGLGDDCYRFGRGDGYDGISEAWQSGGGNDTLELGAGIAPKDVSLYRNEDSLVVVLDNSTTQISVANFFVDANARIERIRFADGIEWDLAAINAMVITGTPNAMTGTAGNDTFIVDHVQDTISEGAAQGTDTVQSNVSWTLGANLENLTLAGMLYISGQGNALGNIMRGNGADNHLSGKEGNDTIYGGAGDDDLFGGEGADTLYGGAGNDFYRDRDLADKIVEEAGEGIDTIMSLYGGVMPDNVENFVITGTWASYQDVTGNSSDNTITGNDGANILDGGQGADTLIGRWGSDTYVVDNIADQVIENKGEGIDTVRSAISYTLGADVENLVLIGNAQINGTGNDLNNVMSGSDSLPEWGTATGNHAANILAGGKGDDVYYLGNGDKAVENVDEGIDTVHIRYTPTGNLSLNDALFRNIENLVISTYGDWNIEGSDADNSLTGGSGNDRVDGGAGNDRLYGGEGSDRLDGGTGIDTMEGGKGDDTFVVDNPGDIVAEQAYYSNYYGGVDTVRSSISYALAPAVEKLILTGSDPVSGSGNELNNTLDGSQNIAANTMAGHAGDDTYIVGGGDTIVEAVDEGIDTAFSDVSHALEENVESLYLVGSANIGGLGNGADNVLRGNSGDNTLRGGAGDDTVAGGNGSDTYVFHAGDGRDTIDNSANDYATSLDTIRLGSGIAAAAADGLLKRVDDDLVLTMNEHDAITVLGHFASENTAIDRIVFDDGTVWDYAEIELRTAPVPTPDGDILKGTSRNDTVHGLAGDDMIWGDSGDDRLFGDEGRDSLFGGGGDDLLDGGTGADKLIGGAGHDVYIVDNPGDAITENANEGVDMVHTSVSFTLGVNIENLTLTGLAAINGTGNTLSNVIVGNTAGNTLNGGSGADILSGGLGNDTYVVDHAGDTIIENIGEGSDLVQSSVTAILSANVENLILTGTTAINGTGNALDNILTGNSAANTLTGGAGNDILNGAAGADKMSGGSGNDTYAVDNIGDAVTENASDGIDEVQSSISFTLSANVEALTLTGTAAINGSGNTLHNLLIGNSANNTLNGQSGNDLMQGGAGNDSITDTAGNNLLDGGAGTDSLTGGAGREFIIGGAGNDSITTGTGADIIAFNRGDGQDTVLASTGKDNTLSLGKGIKYADLLFKKSANDLILVTGAGEQLTFKGWYASSNNRSVANLQVIIEGTADHDAGSTNILNNKKIVQFGFDGLATKFDQARAANPSLTSWALSSSLMNFYLGSSDTAALGGDLAYQYARNGNLSGFSMMPAQALLADSQFGVAAQTFDPQASVQGISPRLI